MSKLNRFVYFLNQVTHRPQLDVEAGAYVSSSQTAVKNPAKATWEAGVSISRVNLGLLLLTLLVSFSALYGPFQ